MGKSMINHWNSVVPNFEEKKRKWKGNYRGMGFRIYLSWFKHAAIHCCLPWRTLTKCCWPDAMHFIVDILPLPIAFYQLCLIGLPKNMVPKNLWFLWFIIIFLIQVAIDFGVPNLQADPCSPAHVRHVILGMVVVCGYRFIIGCSDTM